MWTLYIQLCGLCIMFAGCTGYDLYGCHLPDNPTKFELFEFQSCVSTVNGISSGEGGRWGRSVRARSKREQPGAGAILSAIQPEFGSAQNMLTMPERNYGKAFQGFYNIPFGYKTISGSPKRHVSKRSTMSDNSDIILDVLRRRLDSERQHWSGRFARSAKVDFGHDVKESVEENSDEATIA